jgi:hypothetical protein
MIIHCNDNYRSGLISRPFFMPVFSHFPCDFRALSLWLVIRVQRKEFNAGKRLYFIINQTYYNYTGRDRFLELFLYPFLPTFPYKFQTIILRLVYVYKENNLTRENASIHFNIRNLKIYFNTFFSWMLI